MDDIREVLIASCSALIIGEIIYYLTPKDKIVNVIYGVLYTLIIIATVRTIADIVLNLDIGLENSYSDDIDEYINEYYKIETEEVLKDIITESLDVLHIECSDIETIIDVHEDTVTVISIKVILEYKSDIDNAKVMLDSVFNGTIPLEVEGER